jgi:hypothetical protein
MNVLISTDLKVEPLFGAHVVVSLLPLPVSSHPCNCTCYTVQAQPWCGVCRAVFFFFEKVCALLNPSLLHPRDLFHVPPNRPLRCNRSSASPPLLLLVPLDSHAGGYSSSPSCGLDDTPLSATRRRGLECCRSLRWAPTAKARRGSWTKSCGWRARGPCAPSRRWAPRCTTSRRATRSRPAPPWTSPPPARASRPSCRAASPTCGSWPTRRATRCLPGCASSRSAPGSRWRTSARPRPRR